MTHPFQLQVITAQGSHTVGHDGSATPLSDILRRADFPLNTRCGGQGICDGCTVELVSGSLIEWATGEIVQANGLAQAVRSCQYHLQSPEAVIRIPQRSSLQYQPKIETDYRINVSWSHEPLYRQLLLPPPEGGAWTRNAIVDAVAAQDDDLPVVISPAVDLEKLRMRGQLYATVEFQLDRLEVTALATTAPPPALGAAIDIGTTTVVVMVVDLQNGRVVGRSADLNRQMRLGDDVVTRINLCMTEPDKLGQLQELVAAQTIVPLLQEALSQSGAAAAAIKCFSIAGNTTMMHLLAGVDPSPLGVAPFTPAFIGHKIMPADEILRPWPSSARCHLLPGATAYIGADITAGMIASGLIYDDGPSLLVDVGTNGEIVLKHGQKILGCATAAGPAFEGAGLSSGQRAGRGAISHVSIGRDPFRIKIECIGGESDPLIQPIGICGSAYVDFLGQARLAALVNEFGKFQREGLPADVLERIIPWDNHDLAFHLATGPGKQPIVVSQRDISRLLQAKAAIAAGILTLLEQARLSARQVKTVYLAGGFGTHLDRSNAIACGLLPGFTPEQIQPVGNTALAGAYLSLMDGGLLSEVARAGEQMKVIELNLDPGFESRYIDQLMLS